MFPIDFSVKPINYIYFISWWLWIRRYSTRLVALISGGYEVLNWNNSGSEHREGKGDHHGLQETKRQLFTFLGTTISTNLSWSAKAQRVVHTAQQQRLHFLRVVLKNNSNQKLLKTIDQSTMESILT